MESSKHFNFAETSPEFGHPHILAADDDSISEFEDLCDQLKNHIFVVISQSSLSNKLKHLAVQKAVSQLFPEDSRTPIRNRSGTFPQKLTKKYENSPRKSVKIQTNLPSRNSKSSYRNGTPLAKTPSTPFSKTPPKTPKTPKTPRSPTATSQHSLARQRSYSVGSYLSKNDTNVSCSSTGSNNTIISTISAESYTSVAPETDYHKASGIFGSGIKSLRRPFGALDREQPRLDDLLYRPHLEKYFEEFLRSKYANENIEFIKAVDEFRIKPPNIKLDRVTKIYTKFFGDDADCQINIEHCVLKDLERRIEKVKKGSKKESKLPQILPMEFFRYLSGIFDEADLSVRTLLESCQVPEFLKTDEWIEALNVYDQGGFS